MSAARRLRPVVVFSEVWFSLALALPLGYSVPKLLLIDRSLQTEALRGLILCLLLAAVLASLHGWLVTGRHRGVLQALASGTDTVHPTELRDLGKQPARLARLWVWWHLLTFASFATALRPARMDLTAGAGIALLSGLMVATASLPLSGVLRGAFLRAIELAPPAAARAMIAQVESTPEGRSRITRRLVLALATPTFLVALGTALITHAHLRRADERNREIMALTLARAALDRGPYESATGTDAALERAARLGFSASLSTAPATYRVDLGQRGLVELTTPLDHGSATVRFNGSTLGTVGLRQVLWSLLAVCVAVLIGYLLGASFTNDLLMAVRRVRLLGTNAEQGPIRRRLPHARFALVDQLGGAIQRLAERFAVFAEAQEAAIQAREATVRARSSFFASVSHDLKSPLNAILGFAELVNSEPLTPGQAESLHAIQSRGKELLALIETILDAARVEAGQLNLVYDEIEFSELYRAARERATRLAGDFVPQIWDEIDPRIPPLLCDRVRLARALATFIAYSVRATQGGKMRLRAEMDDPDHVRIDVDVPGHLHTPKELELMMAESQSPGKRAHRGLALGLRLARSVIELHHGDVRVINRGPKGAMFCITLETVQPSSRRSSPV